MRRRLLIIGDSITLGATEVLGNEVLSSTPRTYVQDLHALLPHWEIETDAALHRTTGEAVRILGALLSSRRPDVVLFQIGGNDCDVDWRRFVVSRGTRLKSNVSVAKYAANLRELVAICRSASAVPVLSDVPTFDLILRTRWLTTKLGVAVDQAVTANGGGQLEVERRCAEYIAAMETVAAETGSPMAHWGAALAHLPKEVKLGPDGVHPGPAAHPLIAEACARALRSAFAAGVTGSAAVGA